MTLSSSLTWMYFRCEKYINVNSSLREQLEESHQMNEALTNDLQKLTNDWETLREEMIIKEDEWKDEEQVNFGVRFSFR